MSDMSIEEQIRIIVKDEVESQTIELESRLQKAFNLEMERLKEQIVELKNQVDTLNERANKLEEELSSRWGLLVKLRKYTLDQLMAEYKRLTGSMRSDQEESDENVEK